MYTSHCLKVLVFMVLLTISLTFSVKNLFFSDDSVTYMNKKTRATSQSSFFSGADFFASKNSKPYLRLRATESEWDPAIAMQIHENPEGVIFDEGGKELTYLADSGLINEKPSKEILLKSKVLLKTDGSVINADEVQFKFKNEFFSASGNVHSSHLPATGKEKILVKSKKLEYRHGPRVATYTGDVRGRVQRLRPYEQGVDFAASTMVVDLNKSHVELKNNVNLKKQELKASALHGEIFLENYNKKLKYYQLYDDVKVRETILLRNGKKIVRQAFSEKLEGYNQSDRIVLTGSPKVIQEKEIIKGNKISLTQNNEIIEVDDANSKFIIKGKGL